MSKYRKKPVVIEAVQLRWDTWGEMCAFAPVGTNGCRGVYVAEDGSWSDGVGRPNDARIGLLIPTLEGEMLGVQDDWIIKGVQGEFYPCKPDIFAATYGEVEDDD